MKKIGYLVPEFPGQTHAFFWREINALEKLNTQVTILSTRPPKNNTNLHAFSDAAKQRTTYLNKHVIKHIGQAITHPGRLVKYLRYIQQLQETPAKEKIKLAMGIPLAEGLIAAAEKHQFTHTHVHSFANSAHIVGMANAACGLTYSLVLHGDPEVYGKDHKQKTANASTIVTVTRPLQTRLNTDLPETKDKTHVITMGVDTSAFETSNKSSSSAFTGITVARLNATKGHTFLFQALELLNREDVPIQWNILGDGPHRGAIEAEIKSRKIENIVTLHGAKPEHEVKSMLQQADCFVLPSFGKGEAAPVSVMEAMSCGVPVVCTIIGGTADMIQSDQDGFLVPQKDPQAIANHLRTLATDPKLRHAMGQNARRSAEERFCHIKQAQKLLDILP